MLKCAFNKVAKHGCSAWVFSCQFNLYFQNTFSKEHLWVAASVQGYHCTAKINGTNGTNQ